MSFVETDLKCQRKYDQIKYQKSCKTIKTDVSGSNVKLYKNIRTQFCHQDKNSLTHDTTTSLLSKSTENIFSTNVYYNSV